MTVKYPHPPVVEAIFEIYYSSPNWSSALPGIFYQKLKEHFPIVRERAAGFQFSSGFPSVSPIAGTTQFVATDNDSLIQLSGSIFTVNIVNNYKSWEDFLPIIRTGLTVFFAEINPSTIQQIGLRYLNKIDVDAISLSNVQKCFNLGLNVPEGLKYDSNHFQILVEFPIEVRKEFIAVNFASLHPHAPYKAPVMFDIGCHLNGPIQYDADGILEWLDKQAHNKLNDVFENSLTDFCKEKFK